MSDVMEQEEQTFTQNLSGAAEFLRTNFGDLRKEEAETIIKNLNIAKEKIILLADTLKMVNGYLNNNPEILEEIKEDLYCSEVPRSGGNIEAYVCGKICDAIAEAEK